MKTLYLHVGHGKTGSSYIQSALACSMETLSSCGISYPGPRNRQKAMQGVISSGNGNRILGSNGFQLSSDHTLFSSERFFTFLISSQRQREFKEIINSLDVQKIKILLFIRDPVENCCSNYQQAVKRGGDTGDISKVFQRFRQPEYVNRALDMLDRLGSETTVLNYSRERTRLLECVEMWLDVPSGTLKPPEVQQVNRSMTRSEIALLIELNKAMGERCGSVLADHLCNELPDIRADDLRPDTAEQEALWDRMQEQIERVNARVPPDARYDRNRDIRPTSDQVSGFPCFTTEQLSVIAGQLAHRELRLRQLKNNTDNNHNKNKYNITEKLRKIINK